MGACICPCVRVYANTSSSTQRLCFSQSNKEISELFEGIKRRCEELGIPPPAICVADNCCHISKAVIDILKDIAVVLDVWHFIKRYDLSLISMHTLIHMHILLGTQQ